MNSNEENDEVRTKGYRCGTNVSVARSDPGVCGPGVECSGWDLHGENITKLDREPGSLTAWDVE